MADKAHTEYHKQSEHHRVVCRGRNWFVQEWDGSDGSSKRDPWHDISTAKATKAEALTVMYTKKPEVRNAKA